MFHRQDHPLKLETPHSCKMCNRHRRVWIVAGLDRLTVPRKCEVVTEHKLYFCCLPDGHRDETCFSSRECVRLDKYRSHRRQMLNVLLTGLLAMTLQLDHTFKAYLRVELRKNGILVSEPI